MPGATLPFCLAALSMLLQEEERATVTPGDGTVDGSFIQAYESSWIVTQIAADGSRSDGGQWTDDVAILDLEGREVLKRTQRVYDAEGVEVNTQVRIVEHASLAPVRSHFTALGGFVNHVDYDGLEVSGFLVRGDEARAWKCAGELDQPAFDWNIFGTLLLGFPLAPGYEARFPYVDIAPNGQPPGSPEFALVPSVQWQELRVTRTESIAMPGAEPTRAFVVEAPWGTGSFTFWLSKSPPYILKLTQSLEDGGRTEWSME